MVGLGFLLIAVAFVIIAFRADKAQKTADAALDVANVTGETIKAALRFGEAQTELLGTHDTRLNNHREELNDFARRVEKVDLRLTDCESRGSDLDLITDSYSSRISGLEKLVVYCEPTIQPKRKAVRKVKA